MSVVVDKKTVKNKAKLDKERIDGVIERLKREKLKRELDSSILCKK